MVCVCTQVSAHHDRLVKARVGRRPLCDRHRFLPCVRVSLDTTTWASCPEIPQESPVSLSPIREPDLQMRATTFSLMWS